MTDKRIAKLCHFGIAQADAEALIKAGYGTPRKIKAATSTALSKIVPKSRRGRVGK